MRSNVNAKCVTHPAKLVGMESPGKTPGERLRWARMNRTEYESGTVAALSHGWTVSTYLGHENGDRNPSRAAAKKYAAVYRVPWEWILEGGTLPDKKRTGSTAIIPTKGEVAAGQWLDIDFSIDPSDFDQVPIAADPSYPFDAQYGLIVRGTSINKIAPPGDVLHCLDLGIAAVDPDEDDLVIVERRRAQQGQREVTAKRIRRHGRVTVLSPDSTDKKWTPIELDPKKAKEDEEVAVVALVLGIYKALRKRR